jgi:Tfp pilus assembly protein PilF
MENPEPRPAVTRKQWSRMSTRTPESRICLHERGQGAATHSNLEVVLRYIHFASLALLVLFGTMGAAPTVEQLDAKVQILEERIGALDDKEELRAAADERDLDHRLQLAQQQCETRHVEAEKRMNMYAGGLVLLLTLLGFIGYRTISGWIKHTIQERVDHEIGKTVTSERLSALIAEHSKAPTAAMLATFLENLENQAKMQTAKFDALRKDYADGLEQLKAQKAASVISTAPSPAISEELRKFVENLVKTKTEAGYTFDDWFFKGVQEAEQRDYAAAAGSFEHAVAMRPKSVEALGNTAWSYQLANDAGKAEGFYKRAIEANPKEANALAGYASFMSDVRKDYDKAEEYFRRATEANPKEANALGAYAHFLSDKRKDYDKAEEYFRRATEADPNDANIVGNHAQMLFIKGDISAATDLVNRALASAPADESRLECQFYLYAHEPNLSRRAEALREVKKLVTSGVRSKGWNLSGNVARAGTDGHHNVALLRKLADVIADKTTADELAAFDEWNTAS